MLGPPLQTLSGSPTAAIAAAVHGTATELAYFVNTNEVTSNANFAVDVSGTAIIINAATNAPQAALDIWTGSQSRPLVLRGGSGALGTGAAIQFTTGGIGGDVNTLSDNLGSIIASVSATSPTSADLQIFTNLSEVVAERMTITAAGHIVTSLGGISGIPPAAGYDTANLNIIEGFGTVPAHPAGTLAKFQNNSVAGDDAYVAILAGTAGESGVVFGNSGDADRGRVIYDHNVDELQHYMSGAQGVTFTGGDNIIVRPAVSPDLSGPNGIIYGSDVASANCILSSTSHATKGFVDIADEQRMRTSWPDPTTAGTTRAARWAPTFEAEDDALIQCISMSPVITDEGGPINYGVQGISFTPTATITCSNAGFAGMAAGGTLTYETNATGVLTLFNSSLVAKSETATIGPPQVAMYVDETIISMEETASFTAAANYRSFRASPTIRALDTATLAYTLPVQLFHARVVLDKDAGATLTVPDLRFFNVAGATKSSGVTLTNQVGLFVEDMTAATNNYSVLSEGSGVEMRHAGDAIFGTTAFGASTFGGVLAALGTIVAIGDLNTVDGTVNVDPPDAEGVVIGPFGASAGNTGELRFLELAANGTNYTGLKAPDSLSGNVIYTLPTGDGSSGQQLTTNGAGVLSWAAAGGGSGGTISSTFVRFTGTDTVNSTTFTNASDGTNTLQFAVGANQTWVFRAVMGVSGSATSDAAFRCTGPASVTAFRLGVHSNLNVQGDNHGVTALSTSTGRVSINGSGNTTIFAEGMVVTNANTGNITIQWATNSGTDTQTMNAGSFLLALRIV